MAIRRFSSDLALGSPILLIVKHDAESRDLPCPKRRFRRYPFQSLSCSSLNRMTFGWLSSGQQAYSFDRLANLIAPQCLEHSLKIVSALLCHQHHVALIPALPRPHFSQYVERVTWIIVASACRSKSVPQPIFD